jgi:two-component system response regulator FixJ
MISTDHTVFIIDDDTEVCAALRWLFESIHLNVETYHSAPLFLKQLKNNKPGCLIIDVRMPEMSGLELLEQLKVQKSRLPVIIMTGYGDIPMAVRAMKAGALDFFLKPFNDQYLLEIVQKYINQSINNHSLIHSTHDINERINCLSDRERQIIELIMDGSLNKEIAFELSISLSTVEAHRANIMKKMKAKNLAQLIKMYLQVQFIKEYT